MTPSDKLREIVEKTFPLFGSRLDEWRKVERDRLLSDLTALISENYVEKKDAGYPLEFVEWLIKDQEIFFGELNEEYILNDNIHVDGRKLQTIDELFNYWANNEK
jgi:hypothetical protein